MKRSTVKLGMREMRHLAKGMPLQVRLALPATEIMVQFDQELLDKIQPAAKDLLVDLKVKLT